ncbi:phosphotransferase [Halorhodospira halochloris]|uniref:phosphotransferase n=1 Tax=Halorhodospira halochloris TaxID=1052 RepID=UPI00076F7420|nr:phosphotransferase [Halorhodospira halochloris]MBK1652892.1 hypothetical protein [Halorhodospira halochloris]
MSQTSNNQINISSANFAKLKRGFYINLNKHSFADWKFAYRNGRAVIPRISTSFAATPTAAHYSSLTRCILTQTLINADLYSSDKIITLPDIGLFAYVREPKSRRIIFDFENKAVCFLSSDTDLDSLRSSIDDPSCLRQLTSAKLIPELRYDANLQCHIGEMADDQISSIIKNFHIQSEVIQLIAKLQKITSQGVCSPQKILHSPNHIYDMLIELSANNKKVLDYGHWYNEVYRSLEDAKIEKVFSHGDLSTKNILLFSGRPRFIDWEHSCYRSHVFDIMYLYYRETRSKQKISQAKLKDFWISSERLASSFIDSKRPQLDIVTAVKIFSCELFSHIINGWGRETSPEESNLIHKLERIKRWTLAHL